MAQTGGQQYGVSPAIQPMQQPAAPPMMSTHVHPDFVPVPPANLNAVMAQQGQQGQQVPRPMPHPHRLAQQPNRSASWHPGGHPPIQDTRTQLFVSNLPFRVRWQDLKDLMRKCGTVLRADVALSPSDGRSRGFGVVLFARHEDALKAIDMYHGFSWQTRVLDVRIDSHDPRGEIALAEANRQQAMQQQAERFQQAMHQNSAGPNRTGPPGSNVMPHQQPPPPPPPPLPLPGAPASSSSSSGPGSIPPSASSAASSSPRPGTANWSGTETSATTASPRLAPGAMSPQRATPTASPHLKPVTASEPPLPPDDIDERISRAEQARILSEARSATPNAGGRLGHPPPLPSMVNGGSALGVHQYPQGPQPPPPPPMPPFGGPGPNMGTHNGFGQSYGTRPPAAGLNPVPAQYVGRHLFVGNLPFNCQWQELKDLMRQCGNVLRADIATGADGRSRGFGSVLFATPQDAERAVQQLNNFEFNGRVLKVHFDKYSSAIPPPGPNPPFNAHAPGGYQMHHHPPLPQHPPSTTSNPSFGAFGMHQHPAHQGMPMLHDGRAAAALGGNSFFEQDPRAHGGAVLWQQPTTAQVGLGGVSDDLALPSSVEEKLSGIASPRNGDASHKSDTHSDEHNDGESDSQSPSNRSHHPSRITMPPPSTFPFSVNGGPLSPATAGRLPPMTPSMPAFTFGTIPQTPPVYPQSFFSPGVGQFSPQVGSPFFGPGMAYLNNSLNAAPGAPLHRQIPVDYNPMFPMTSAQESALYDEPYGASRGNAQPGQQGRPDDGERTPPAGKPNATGNSGQSGGEYFPPVNRGISSSSSSSSHNSSAGGGPSPAESGPQSNGGASSAPGLSSHAAATSALGATTAGPPRPDVTVHSRSADPTTTSVADASTRAIDRSLSDLHIRDGPAISAATNTHSRGTGSWGDLPVGSGVGARGADLTGETVVARRRSYAPGVIGGTTDIGHSVGSAGHGLAGVTYSSSSSTAAAAQFSSSDVRRRFERDFEEGAQGATRFANPFAGGGGPFSSAQSGGAQAPPGNNHPSLLAPASSSSAASSLNAQQADVLQARRASFEDVGAIVGKQRMKFGTSIWGTN